LQLLENERKTGMKNAASRRALERPAGASGILLVTLALELSAKLHSLPRMPARQTLKMST
jgi:hypothetical protein